MQLQTCPLHRALALFLLVLLACSPAAARVRVIHVLFVDPAGTSFELGARRFKSELERRSHGQLKVEVYSDGAWNGKHLDELPILQAVRQGSPEMCLVTTAPLGNYSRSLQVLDTPFLFRNYEQVDRVLDGHVGQGLLATLRDSGLMGLGFMDSGFRIFTSSKPLARVADFKNLRVRVMQSAVYYNFVRLLGATPVPSPVDKIYDMARQGYIDVADRSYPTFWQYRLYEVQKYILESNHSYAAKAMIINEDFYRHLSPDLQVIVAKSALIARDAQRQGFRQDLATVKANCEKMGLHIDHLSDDDRRHMRQICQPIYDQAEAQVGADLMRELTAP